MILVDANILMYAAGASHPNKKPCADFLRLVAKGEIDAALDAEVLQEILHRYRAIDRWSQGRQVFDEARRLFPLVVPITAPVLDMARSLMDSYESLAARDALHAAVVLHHGIEAICSFDRDFDQIQGLNRIEPPVVSEAGQPTGWIAAVDGCKAGWLRLVQNLRTGEITSDVSTDAVELFERRPKPVVLAIDIPIGLTDAGPRICDRLARALLGRPRGSSVFPAPIRPALDATKREEASRIHQAADGRRVGAQAWSLYRKIREVDAALRARPDLTSKVREVHPEVSFRAWNDDQPMELKKSTREGRRERRRLVDRDFGSDAFDKVRAGFRVADVAHDDILDAFAALWTASRIHRGLAVTLPEKPVVDAAGLRMEIVF